jgi:hypothetical protein
MGVPGEETGRLSPRARAVAVWGLVGLGTLLLLVGSLAVWVERQVLDTDAWVDTSSEVLEDNDVRSALSLFLVDQLYTNVDVPARLEQRLPPNLEGLAEPLAGALREPAEGAVAGLLQRPRVQALWEEANRAANQELIGILEGETREGVSTEEGTVTLDLRVLVVEVGGELGFGEELDAQLPPDAGQITVLESDELEAIQTLLKVIKILTWFVLLAALAAFAGAVWLARKRREVLRAVGVVLLLVGILLLVIREVLGSYIVDALAQGESAREAGGSLWTIGTSLLAEVSWGLIAAGLLILLGTVLAGPSEAARRVRGAIAPSLRHRPETGWAALAVVYLLIVLWGPLPALRNWLTVVALGGLVALGFEAFRRLTVLELEADADGPQETRDPVGSAAKSKRPTS